MTALLTPRRLLQLDALFTGGRRQDTPRLEPCLHDTRMPADPAVLMMQGMAASPLGRIAAEVALEAGGRRVYAPRPETQVLELRRGR